MFLIPYHWLKIIQHLRHTLTLYWIIVCYLRVRCTGVAPPESRFTARVLQTKAGFVSLGHITFSDDVQQVVVTEGVHAVVVSEGVEQNTLDRSEGVVFLPGSITLILGKLTGDSCASPTDIWAWQEGSPWCLGWSLSGGTAAGLWSRCLLRRVHKPTLDGSQEKQAYSKC